MKIEDEKEYKLSRCTAPDDCEEYTKLGKHLTEDERALLDAMNPDYVGKDLALWRETLTPEEIIEKLAFMYNGALNLVKELLIQSLTKEERKELKEKIYEEFKDKN